MQQTILLNLINNTHYVHPERTLKSPGQINISANTTVVRITALWALSESLLGGILHGFHIPFRGLIIASASIVFISIIFYYSRNPAQILKSALLVIMVKFAVAPHTPVTAFFAVAYQSVFGYLLFSFIRSFKIAAVLLGIISLTTSGLQKIIVLTLILGFSFWKIVDQLVLDLLNFIGITMQDTESASYSVIIILFYILIHFIAGITAGIVAGKIPSWIDANNSEKIYRDFQLAKNTSGFSDEGSDLNKNPKEKYRNAGITALVIALFTATFLFDQSLSGKLFGITLMLIRALLLIYMWYVVISPLLNIILLKILQKSKSRQADNVEQIINLFPDLKRIVYYSWNSSSEFKNLSQRLKKFIACTLLLLFNSSIE